MRTEINWSLTICTKKQKSWKSIPMSRKNGKYEFHFQKLTFVNCEFPAADQFPKNGPIRRNHRDSMSSQENEREHFDDNSSTSIDFDWFHLKSIIFLNWHFHNFNLFKLLSFLQLFFNVQIYFSQISLLNTAYSQAMQNDFILTQYEILIIWPIWFVLVLLNKIILQNGLNFSQNMLMRLWDTLVN